MLTGSSCCCGFMDAVVCPVQSSPETVCLVSPRIFLPTLPQYPFSLEGRSYDLYTPFTVEHFWRNSEVQICNPKSSLEIHPGSGQYLRVKCSLFSFQTLDKFPQYKILIQKPYSNWVPEFIYILGAPTLEIRN